MTANDPLLLYTRPGCHLCEHAMALLETLGQTWEAVDIEGDEALESYYGLTIPVVRCPAHEKELHFPFGEAQLKRFLEECSLRVPG